MDISPARSNTDVDRDDPKLALPNFIKPDLPRVFPLSTRRIDIHCCDRSGRDYDYLGHETGEGPAACTGMTMGDRCTLNSALGVTLSECPDLCLDEVQFPIQVTSPSRSNPRPSNLDHGQYVKRQKDAGGVAYMDLGDSLSFASIGRIML